MDTDHPQSTTPSDEGDRGSAQPASRRDAKLVVRVADDELAAIDEFAEAMGASRSDAVRALVLQPVEAVRGLASARPRISRTFVRLDEQQTATLKATAKQVGEVGVALAGGLRNWNQIAKKVNAGELLLDLEDSARMAALEQQLAAAQEQLAEVARAVNALCVERPGGASDDGASTQ